MDSDNSMENAVVMLICTQIVSTHTRRFSNVELQVLIHGVSAVQYSVLEEYSVAEKLAIA